MNPGTSPLTGLSLSGPDLLGRPLRDIPTRVGEEMLRGATVLVTGAAGSVGSALVARLLQLGAARIVAVDHHEASLFRLGRDLGNPEALEPRLVDVRNRDKMRRLLDERRPSVVFHLAAYKHVPFGESEPDETIAVNVLASVDLAQAAAESGATHFVYPSSDKAVNPPSLYGATKRIAESWVLRLAASQSTSVMHVVRYVNILGTSGSVIETFARQALAGQPFTLTDERMTRYWMAMVEATSLLVHSLGLDTGSCCVLDVGEPIAVRDMALRVARAVRSDLTTPEILITGSRPGERLAEELLSASERVTRCDDDPVWRVVHSRRDSSNDAIPAIVEELRALIVKEQPDVIRARAMEFARQLQ